MSKSRIWDTLRPKRRALQALALTAITAACIALSVAGGSGSTAVLAQQGPPPLKAHRGHKVLLPGSMPQALHTAKRLGAENSGRALRLTIGLALSDPNGLAALIASQQDPKSSQYHKYITPQTFLSRYAPTPQSVAAVRQFLTSSGLKVTGVSANRTLISASGTVAQVQSAFGVTINQYQLGKRTVYGPDRAPQIPDTLANIVLDVGGLNDVFQATPLLVPAATGATQAAHHAAAGPHTSPVIGANGPTNLRGAYDATNVISAGGDGTNQHVAVFELAPYIASDIASYRAQYSLPSAPITNIIGDTGAIPTCTAGDPTCDTGNGIIEADLDIEVVSALAPNAAQDIYVGTNDFQGVLDTYNKVVTDNTDAVMTTSWGMCEPYAGSYDLHALDQIFAQGAAQGQTFLAAAGDAGSDDCAYRTSTGTYASGGPPYVDSPAGDPYVVGVGGTSLSLSGGGYGSESVWNGGLNGGAGGGGISSYFMQPSWQVGGGVVNAYSTGERQVPDVTADADPNTGYSEYCSSTAECSPYGGPWIEIGGTSAAAPLWAGILADINAYEAVNAVSSLGWANKTLYQLFGNSQTYLPYHDITTGNNDMDFGGTPYAGDYPATACYDQASGMGSPDAWNIARDVQGGVKTGGGGPCAYTPTTTTELIKDGGFEQTPSPWTLYSNSGSPEIYSSSDAHTGQAAFFPCSYPDCDDRASQTITLPSAASVHSAKLRFWVETFSLFPAFSATPPCIDHIYVTFSTPDGTVVPGGNILPSSCVSSQIFNYEYENVDVTSLLQAHGGQQLTLTFRGTTANEAPLAGYYTGWAIDDASLTYS